MHFTEAFIYRIVGPLSPSWKARLLWAWTSGDRSGKAVVDAVVHGGDIALDIGANFGFYTDRLARLVGPAGCVYVFEPHPGYADALTRIAASRGNVNFIPYAVSDKSAHAQLSVPVSPDGANPAMGSIEDRGVRGRHHVIDVATTTLDRELQDVARIRLLKCDVEGHEHEVLLGGLELLRQARPILFLEIEQRHRERPVQETVDLLKELGYDGYMTRQSGCAHTLADFDLERDQVVPIAQDPSTPTPPPDYVKDFLFLPTGRSVPGLARIVHQGACDVVLGPRQK